MNSSLQTCLMFKKQDSPELNLEAAWCELEHLAADGKLLLFVDNVDKPVGEDFALQRLKEIPGAVILTSRQASICDEFETYPIGFLDVEQCKEIYEQIRFKGSGRKVRQEEEQDLKYVIENLAGRHTITVEHLAHLAWTKTWPVKKLREKLEEKGFCLEFHKDGKIVNIQKSYEALYDLSELTEAEQNILEAFSAFPYIPLAAGTCNEWLLADAGVSEEDDVLIGLYQKGWLQFDMGLESYTLHPVFSQFIYDKCKPTIANHYRLINSCRKSLEIPQTGSALQCQQYIPFAESIVEKIDMEKDLQIKFAYVLACVLQDTAEYKKAEKWFRIFSEICQSELGSDHPNTVVGYNNLAYVYEKQGNYGKAKELYEKSLKINERELGENHPNTAISYSNLAGVYVEQGEYN